MHAVHSGLATFLVVCLVGMTTRAADAPSEAVLVDGAAKEHKLKTWKWIVGTRHLSWLEQKEPTKQIDPVEEKKGKVPPKNVPVRPAVGPQALEFREVDSTNYAIGIVTLIPLDAVRGLEFNTAAKTATVRFATGAAEDATRTGSTMYKGSNQFALEAESDRGPLGVAVVKLTGGSLTGGFIKGTFPAKKVEVLKPGRPAAVTITHDKKKVVHTVSDLQALYQFATGAEVVGPALLFKKSLKVELENMRKLVNATPGAIESSFDVTLKDGSTETLTLLNTVKLDGKEATLVGLVGKVPGAYKIYPVHTITELEFDPK